MFLEQTIYYNLTKCFVVADMKLDVNLKYIFIYRIYIGIMCYFKSTDQN